MKIKGLFSRGEATFFRKAEDGIEVFYPWGYPGDAFIVTGAQKNAISAFRFWGNLFICPGFIIIFLMSVAGMMPMAMALYSMAFLSFFYSLFYLSGVFIVRRRSALYLKRSDEDSYKAAEGALYLSYVVTLQICAIVALLEDKTISPSLAYAVALLSAIWSIFLIWLILKIHKHKGFFFSRN